MEKNNQTPNPVPGTPIPVPQPAPETRIRQNPPSRPSGYSQFVYLPDSREFLNLKHVVSVAFDPDSESPVFDESGNPVASAELIAFVVQSAAPWIPGEDGAAYEQQATPYTGRDAAALFLGLANAFSCTTEPSQITEPLTMAHIRHWEAYALMLKQRPDLLNLKALLNLP